MMSEWTLLDRYRLMTRMRYFEEACLEGVATGEIHGELHLGIGQEGVAAGMAGALRPTDAVVSTHRNHLHGIVKGVPLKPMLAEIFERETGLCRGRGGHMHLFDVERSFSTTGIVGASLPVALGYAYAAAMHDEGAAAVGVTGDGGVATGGFHETLTIASGWGLPLVIVVENNGYAISVPIESVSSTTTLAERVAGYGVWCQTVDGTDVEAVASAFGAAVEHARERRGPSLLEATCYRFRGHYEGDAELYRTSDEKERAYADLDPISIARGRLLDRAEASETQLAQIDESSRSEMRELLAEVRADPMPGHEGALDFLFVGDPT